MTNRFGVLLHSDSVRWAAAEGVSKDVIAAVLLLHERSVDEIAPKLSAVELEQVIKLVGRSPRLYSPGTLDALKQRTSPSPQPPSNGGLSNVVAKDAGRAPGTDRSPGRQMPPPSEPGAGAGAPQSAGERGHSTPPAAPQSTVERFRLRSKVCVALQPTSRSRSMSVAKH